MPMTLEQKTSPKCVSRWTKAAQAAVPGVDGHSLASDYTNITQYTTRYTNISEYSQ